MFSMRLVLAGRLATQRLVEIRAFVAPQRMTDGQVPPTRLDLPGVQPQFVSGKSEWLAKVR